MCALVLFLTSKQSSFDPHLAKAVKPCYLPDSAQDDSVAFRGGADAAAMLKA